jgi:hypothetical protein
MWFFCRKFISFAWNFSTVTSILMFLLFHNKSTSVVYQNIQKFSFLFRLALVVLVKYYVYGLWKKNGTHEWQGCVEFQKNDKYKGPNSLEVYVTEVLAQKVLSDWRRTLHTISTLVASNQRCGNMECVLWNFMWQESISKEGEIKWSIPWMNIATWLRDTWCMFWWLTCRDTLYIAFQTQVCFGKWIRKWGTMAVSYQCHWWIKVGCTLVGHQHSKTLFLIW